MFIMPSFGKSLIVEQFQGNYLKDQAPGKSTSCEDDSLCLVWPAGGRFFYKKDVQFNNFWLHVQTN